MSTATESADNEHGATSSAADIADGATEWMVLIDPAWEPSAEEPEAPIHKVMGTWPVDEYGERHRFQPNPVYAPSEEGSPLDPVDGMLQLLARGQDIGTDRLTEAIADIVLGIAVDDGGVAVVRPAPDGVPSVQVTTAPGHRSRVEATAWRSVTAVELADALPTGVDVLLNPDATASMRVSARVFRDAASSRQETGSTDV